MSDNKREDALTPDEKVRAVAADIQTAQLTPLQVVLTRMSGVILAFVLLVIGFIAWVWRTKLPAVPPPSASDADLAHYRELCDIANGEVKEMVEDVFKTVLLPILMLTLGFLLGRKVKADGED